MSDDDRSGLAKAYSVASRITTVCFVMVLPALGGYWLDGRLNTGYVFLIVGLIFGMTAGVWQLIRLVNSIERQAKDS